MYDVALARTEAYAEMWRRFKAMDHAVSRALTQEILHELDREKLLEFTAYLRSSTTPAENLDWDADQDAQLSSAEPFPVVQAGRLRERLEKIPDFRVIKGRSYDQRLQTLISTIEGYAKPPRARIATDLPAAELRVAHALLKKLIEESSFAMHL